MIINDYFFKDDETINERYELASQRVRDALSDDGMKDVPVIYRGYFTESAKYLDNVIRYLDEALDGTDKDLDYLKKRQECLWEHILEEGYEKSYLNPAVAVKECKKAGRLLSAYYALSYCLWVILGY